MELKERRIYPVNGHPSGKGARAVTELASAARGVVVYCAWNYGAPRIGWFTPPQEAAKCALTNWEMELQWAERPRPDRLKTIEWLRKEAAV